MASSTEVIVSLGYDTGRETDLHTYLTAPAEILNDQHLMQVCSNRTHPHGLDGSHQAGAVLIYAGLIRRNGLSEIKEWLLNAPWGYMEADVLIYTEGEPHKEFFTIRKEY